MTWDRNIQRKLTRAFTEAREYVDARTTGADLLGRWFVPSLGDWVEVLHCWSGSEHIAEGTCRVRYPAEATHGPEEHDLWVTEVDARITGGRWLREVPS